ncbi:hypothetical protein [Streptomyces celluloflavus]|uniref:hypothetical protein n=1 Tax=Streptomyces celluloflavus TaxID=58344 RepID=UPI0034607ED6|nr:hypothetical protein OG717_29945 [Streptomyces celluloflavus]
MPHHAGYPHLDARRSDRKTDQPATGDDGATSKSPPPDGPWLTDAGFLARLHTATLTTLDLVKNVLD